MDPTRIDIATLTDDSCNPRVQRMLGWTEHGNHRFDVPFMSEISENLWLGGCESGLILPEDIEHVVSLYKWEHYEVNHALRSSLTVTMFDDHSNDLSQIERIADWVAGCVEDAPTLVHCQAGLNRSSLVVARVLMKSGLTSVGAITALRELRSPAVLCNTSFEDYLRSIDA